MSVVKVKNVTLEAKQLKFYKGSLLLWRAYNRRISRIRKMYGNLPNEAIHVLKLEKEFLAQKLKRLR